MSDEKLNVDLALQNAEKFEKFVDSLTKSNQLVESMGKNFSSVFAQVAALTKETQQLQAALSKASSGNTVAGIGQTLSRGSPTSFLKNAQTSGDIKNFEATMDQVFARLNNRFAKGLSDTIKSVQSSNILQLSSKIQNTPANNVNDLNNQILAQQSRLASAQIQSTQGSGTAKQVELEAAALAKLNAARDQILIKEKESEQVETRILAIQQKLTAATNDYRIAKLASANIQTGDAKATQADQLNRAAILVDKQRLVVEQARLTSEGQYTAELAKQEGRLANLLGLQTRIRDANAAGVAIQERQATVSKLTADNGASLFKIQSQLLINYGLMNQALNLFQFGTKYVVDLDKALYELQAISVTTDTEMKGLTETLVNVSQQGRFSAVEVAKAATIMAQAGFSAKQIQDSIGAVTQFATATGEDLSKAVDVATSAISIFNLNADQMTHVVNVLTGAINLSKLTVDKLSTGLQYAGNIASDMGITLEETVSLLGALSNAGIKSGSTAGTGLRQLLTELENPSKKLIEQLKLVGLSLQDVNVEALGAITVFENLKQAGFNSADAFKAFDIRAAATYLALANNTQAARELFESVVLGNAAIEGNAKQMGSLSNSVAQLKNVFGLLINDLAGPFKDAIVVVAKGLTTLLQVLNSIPGLLTVIGTLLLSALTGAIVQKLALLIGGITGLTGSFARMAAVVKPTAVAIDGLAVAEGAAGVAAVESAAGVTIFGTAARGLLAFLGPVGIAVALVTTAMAIFGGSSNSAAEKLDKLKAASDEAFGKIEEGGNRIESVDTELKRLTDRYANLKTNSAELGGEVLNMQLKFGRFSDELATGAIKTVDGLMVALQNLRAEMSKTNAAEIQKFLNTQTNLVREKAKQLQSNSQNNASNINSYQNGDLVTRTQFPVGAGPDYYSGRFDSELPGTSNVIKNSNATNQQVAGLASQLTKYDATNATEDQRQKIESLLADARGKVLLQQNEVSKQAQLLDDTVDHNTATYSQLSGFFKQTNDGLESSLLDINAMQADVLNSNQVARDQLKRTFEASPLYNKVNQQITDLQEQIKQEQAKIHGNTTDADKAKIKANIESYKKQISDIADGIDKAITDSHLDAWAGEKGPLVGLIAGQSKPTTSNPLLKGVLDTLPAGASNTSGGLALAGLQQKAHAATSDATNAIANTMGTVKEHFDKLTELLKAQIEEAKRKIAVAADNANNQIAQIDAIVAQATDKTHGGLRDKLSDADVSRLGDQKNDLQTVAIQAQIDQLKVAIPIVDRLVAREGQLNDAAQGKLAGSPNDVNAIKNAAGTQRDYNSALDQQRELLNQNITLQAQMNARLGEAGDAEHSLGDNIQYAAEKWLEQNKLNNDFGLNVQKNVTDVLNTANDSMTTFVTSVVSGTATIGSAFRTLATSILQSMLKIAANKIASGLFSKLFSFGTSLIGGATDGFGQGIVQGNAGELLSGLGSDGLMPEAHGGYLRRAASGYSTPSSTRDSVPILARPGEYVLRNSAVDMIGRSNLDALNASGNTKVQKSGSSVSGMASGMQPVVPAPINVYLVTPQQQPTLSKNDVIVAITQDMMKNGSTSKAVKQVLR